jgi:hypothetical protein
VTGEWRKLHSEELRILYSSPNVIPHVAPVGEERKVYKVLIGKFRSREITGKTEA